MLDKHIEFAAPHVWKFVASDIDQARAIFDALDQGLCTVEVQFSSTGSAVDYVFLAVNAAFQGPRARTDAVGRSMRSLRPDHEEHWFHVYGEIARTGEPQRFVAEAKA